MKNKVFTIPKYISYTSRVLENMSPKLATDFAFKLFMTPYRFPRPKREEKMYEKARKEVLFIPKLNKTIQLYHCGTGTQKVLLIHGWAGRGTQLHSIAESLSQKGFHAISFDAPAHGDSVGKVTNMTEFIACIHEIDKQMGPFTFGIGHSLGAMALMNAASQGLKLEKIITIGSGNSIDDICHSFVKRIGMKERIGDRLKKKLDKVLGNDSEELSAYKVANKINIPTLLIHDEEDDEVPIHCVYDIASNLKNHSLFVTKKLGHRKILWHVQVIEKIHGFLNQ